MNIEKEIKDIEAHNKYAADFYDYEGWELDDIIWNIAYNKEGLFLDEDIQKEVERKLDNTLTYCVLRELYKHGFVSISDKYYKDIQHTCESFKTTRELDELYAELEIEDPYREKESKDTWSKYDYDWEADRE